MKKIIIVNNNMEIGGVQKSLCNLLWEIHDRYDVTLCLFRAAGAYMQELPQDVKVLECPGFFRYLGTSQSTWMGMHKLVRGALASTAKVFGRSAAMKLVLAGERTLPGEYDVAISFLHNGRRSNFYGGVQEFVLRRVNAKKKVAFLHCDYGRCGANEKHNNRLLSRFDQIAACSEGCRESFVQVLPELANRAVTVRNCQPYDQIRAMAQENPVIYPAGQVNIVMVSRLAHEKGIERAMEAMAVVEREGLRPKLHLVGGGGMESALRQRARELDLCDRVEFAGEQTNPYRYMVGADLFLMTSYHEAAPMVIDEAAALNLPVLTTRTTSSHEMVTQPGRGWVCENDQQALNQALLALLREPALLKEKKKTLAECPVDNRLAVEQFISLIEG
jgi:glycosyltransferase involved in cell wall biosynthesis